MADKKPLGLVAIAVYSALNGLMAFVVGSVALFVGAVPAEMGLFAVVGGAVLWFLGAFALAAVYGLWLLQKWGRLLALWVYGASIVLGTIAIFPLFPGQQFSAGNTVVQLAGIAIAIWVLFYLNKAEVKILFRDK